MVVTPDAIESCKLPGVRKLQPPADRWRRLYSSRIGLTYMTARVLKLLAKLRLSRGRAPVWLENEVENFSPQAILTAGVAGAWIQADALSRRLRIPLHIIIHDDHHYAFFWIPLLRKFGEQIFGRTFRRALSRLCISEPMVAEYKKRFGVDGEVLLPSRGRDSLCFEAPRPSIDDKTSGLTVTYAGSLNGRGFERLEAFANEIVRHGHQLVVYTPSKPPSGIKLSSMQLRAPVSSRALVRQMHDESDLLLLWTDFAPENEEVIRTLFPSKMVDYTAACVPILVVAPKYACINDYLFSRPDAAELLNSQQPIEVAMSIDRLASRPAKRLALAKGAAKAGLRDFAYEKAWSTFATALRRGQTGCTA